MRKFISNSFRKRKIFGEERGRKQVKKVTILFAFLFTIILANFQLPTALAAGSNVNLTRDAISDWNYSNDIDLDQWEDGTSFVDKNGKTYAYGVGFNPYSYYSNRSLYVWYDITDYKKTTFEATVSLQKGWNTGDIGQATIEVYADSNLLYKKVLVNSTAPVNLKLAIPAGTKKLKIYNSIQDGTNGIQKVFIGNPHLTDALAQKPASNIVSLFQDLQDPQVSYSNDILKGTLRGSVYQLTDGTNASNAFGFEPYDYYDNNRMSASFYVGDYTYSTLEATVSLDKAYSKGDRGQSEFVIYADNVKIYTKTFKNDTQQQNIKLALPKGTKYLTFYALTKKGTQGNHALILDNARLTKSLAALPADDSISVVGLGTSSVSYSNDVFHNKWSSLSYQLTEGSQVPVGIGLSAYSYYNHPSIWSQYYIGDFTYPTLETTVSLDGRWKTGDRGTTTVTIWADDTLIHQSTLTNTSKTKNIIVSIPKGTTYLKFGSANPKGNAGHAVIFEDPRLTKRPQPPTVTKKVYETSTTVTGKAQAKTTVQVKAAGKVIGTATTSTAGVYSVSIPKQLVGKQLEIVAIDSIKRVSLSTIIKVERDPNSVLKGWSTQNGKLYYYATPGVKHKGWLKYYEKNYYFGTDGAMKTGWLDLSGKRYYLNPSTGSAETGWSMIGGKWYYFDLKNNYLVIDKTKPTISGAVAKTIKLNSSFNPRSGVTAKDNIDGTITSLIQIKGTVNTKKKGTYYVTYTVTDRSRNTTEIKRKIVVN
jgi:glucan-binding YG repeat protein